MGIKPLPSPVYHSNTTSLKSYKWEVIVTQKFGETSGRLRSSLLAVASFKRSHIIIGKMIWHHVTGASSLPKDSTVGTSYICHLHMQNDIWNNTWLHLKDSNLTVLVCEDIFLFSVRHTYKPIIRACIDMLSLHRNRDGLLFGI